MFGTSLGAEAPLSRDEGPVVEGLGGTPGIIQTFLVTSSVLHGSNSRVVLAAGILLDQLAVWIHHREGAGLACPGSPHCVTGIFVRSLLCLNTQELHQTRSGESSIPLS